MTTRHFANESAGPVFTAGDEYRDHGAFAPTLARSGAALGCAAAAPRAPGRSNGRLRQKGRRRAWLYRKQLARQPLGFSWDRAQAYPVGAAPGPDDGHLGAARQQREKSLFVGFEADKVDLNRAAKTTGVAFLSCRADFIVPANESVTLWSSLERSRIR